MPGYDDNNWGVPEPEIRVLPEHAIHHIFDPDGDELPFSYTVGLAARPGRAYELATSGTPGTLAAHLLRIAAEQLHVEHLDPAEGMELDAVLQGGFTVRLHLVEDTAKLTSARDLSGPPVTVWQVLVPDKWGCFPGDEYYAQPDAQVLL
ncbi:DUF4262 domain-containing protein [Streptomyces sp. BV286]|uniref:DUF4262 domain-containing protein n=1 Tax=Streptomyces sp. BV286 TaxID=2849672 RepID=UPI001C2E4A2A|nr:DUF4262 domain-containing protein [Streptomyces sp. BV286]MBV1940827.1 DUF4262 domain-containing protein [Streptomyces sp. BV286]